jgi:CBS domain containing-hemolysin-like protein
MNIPWLTAAVTVVFLLISAFFSASETALFSIPRQRISCFQSSPIRTHRLIYLLLEDGQRTLLMILIGNLFVNVTIVGLILELTKLIPYIDPEFMTLFGATGIILVFGETLPKNIALRYNEYFASAIAPVLYALKIVFRPVLFLLSRLNFFFLKKFAERLQRPSPFITFDELKTGIEKASSQKVIGEQEKNLLLNFLHSGDLPVKHFMIHRSQLAVFHETVTVGQVRTVLARRKATIAVVNRSRSPHHVLGIVRLNALLTRDALQPVARMTAAPVWIAESAKAATALAYLMDADFGIACVHDEFGAFSGLFSIPACAERLFMTAQKRSTDNAETGQIRILSGFDEIEPNFQWLPDSLAAFYPKVRTLNGAITSYLGYIPKKGDIFAIEDWNFYIISSDERIINKVLIQKKGEWI